MDTVINSDLIIRIRKRKSWTQDQLATVSGLSLRTIQRIEKEGVCSLESAQALASALEIDVAAIQNNANDGKYDRGVRMGRFFGLLANTLGFICGLLGITYGLLSGGLTHFQAGVSYGFLGLFCGLTYLAVVLFCEYCRNNRVGYW